MNRRQFLQSTAGAAALLGSRRAWGESAPAKPNILLIVSDQQHWQAMGSVDSSFETPNLDALARSGTVFRDSYCTTPQCSASRSSIYTGFYPHRTTVIGNINSQDHHGNPVLGLPEDFETLGSRLGALGYHTGYTGKWHLGNEGHFSKHFDTADLNGEPHDGATDKALSYLRARAADPTKPFALCVNYINPHDIYQFGRIAQERKPERPEAPVPPPASAAENFGGKPSPQTQFMKKDQGRIILGKPEVYWERYRELYREKCHLVDAQVGRVVAELEELGLADNTIVVYTSDHGDMDTQHRLIYKGPFMYEHMVRVPLVVRMPPSLDGRTPGEGNGFVTGVDILPTLCAFAGSEPDELHGQSLHGYLTGKGELPQRDFVISQYYNKQKWVNPIRMIRTTEFKYNRYIEHGEELYDLKNDPHELVNLARDKGYKKARRELRNELRAWMKTHSDDAFENHRPTNRDGSPYEA